MCVAKITFSICEFRVCPWLVNSSCVSTKVARHPFRAALAKFSPFRHLKPFQWLEAHLLTSLQYSRSLVDELVFSSKGTYPEGKILLTRRLMFPFTACFVSVEEVSAFHFFFHRRHECIIPVAEGNFLYCKVEYCTTARHTYVTISPR